MRFFLPLVLCGMLSTGVSAQSYVTAIWSDYNGFWTSSNASISATQPDSSHMLLAFTLGGTTYSTGVADALLTTNGVTYSDARFRALNFVSTLDLSGAHWQMGSNLDGNTTTVNASDPVLITVDGVPAPLQYSSNATIRNTEAQRLLEDGIKGLNLGTGVVNFPDQTVDIDFPSTGLASGFNDGEPELVVTQMASPNPTDSDSISLVDASGTVLGNWISLNFSNESTNKVADWRADVRNASTGAQVASNNNILRHIQMIGLDFADFGLTAAQVPQVAKVRHAFNSLSDFSFMAYNERSFVDCAAAPVLTLSGITPIPSTSPVALDGEMVPSITGGTAPYSLRQVGTSTLIGNNSWDTFRAGVYVMEAVDDLHCVSPTSARVMIPNVRCNAPG